MKQGPIVVIDGPSGAGKSTVARALAERIGFRYIDTGAMYRGIGWLAREKKVPFMECEELVQLLKNVRLVFAEGKGGTRILVNGTDVTEEIRTAGMGMVASRISAIASVRRRLSSLQRKLGEDGNAVLEGRDMGTVVFPDADFKFFLTASLEERSRRRVTELRARGEAVRSGEILKEMAERDRKDSGRILAPLRKADDAVTIDTTLLTVQEVVDSMIREMESKGV